MRIENFVRGMFTGKGDIKKDKLDNANARLGIERGEREEAKNAFIIEYDLQEFYGPGKLGDEDILELKSFVDGKTKLSPEDEGVLKNEVKLKAEKMISEKFKQAA